jgi:hypothetical protein
MLALGGNVEAYEGLLRSVEIKTGRTIPGQAPVDFDMRAISGFPHEFLDRLKRRLGSDLGPGLD